MLPSVRLETFQFASCYLFTYFKTHILQKLLFSSTLPTEVLLQLTCLCMVMCLSFHSFFFFFNSLFERTAVGMYLSSFSLLLFINASPISHLLCASTSDALDVCAMSHLRSFQSCQHQQRLHCCHPLVQCSDTHPCCHTTEYTVTALCSRKQIQFCAQCLPSLGGPEDLDLSICPDKIGMGLVLQVFWFV